jgi:hypothetical protein
MVLTQIGRRSSWPSWGRRVTRIAIEPDSSRRRPEVYLTVGDDIVIDGLALDGEGDLLLLC